MHCVIIPTYNNALTLSGVILEVLNYCAHVVVVNDGSSDSTPEVLQSFGDRIYVIEYFPNRGKGYALRKGFRYAVEKGFRYAVTIDSDGQHFASDIPLLMEASSRNPQALIIGSRQFNQPNMPAKNSFANKFSNFWFTVQTGHRLNDTQTDTASTLSIK
jgi:glycosyltransferase involved in cell wall biosynthesis